VSDDDENGPINGKRINGHRPGKLKPLALAAALSSGERGTATFDFDVPETLTGVVRLHTEVPEDAYTAQLLGTEREGHGIVLDDSGLVLTIGYLVLEAMAVTLQDHEGAFVPAELVAYDYDTGFGLVRAMRPLSARPIEIGNSSDIAINDAVLVAGHGGMEQTIGARVVSRREFAGYWEYMLDEAIFTAPPHPNWGGAALIGRDGKLLGIGSLYVEDALPEPGSRPGNMFVPIDLLKPVLSELLERGRTAKPPRPWLGMFTAESEGRLEVVALSPDGPAERDGIKPGDAVVKIGSKAVRTLADMYRQIWGTGAAGTVITITVLRGDFALPIQVVSEDRYQRLKFLKDF
jgi:serine protease Do